ncbi:MAG TPA: altronate hydrolase, partial [Sphingobacterium sp.]|nr:altronate hydrolase [Sphingobacterium sp.]
MAIQRYLQIHPMDNVLVALQDLAAGTTIVFEGKEFTLKQAVAAKHKFTIQPMEQDTEILMYGVLVGKLNTPLAEGELITTENLRHAS